MRTRNNTRRTRGRKRIIFGLLAALSATVSWRNIEGLGLGNRDEQGFSKVRQLFDRQLFDRQG